MSNTEVTVFENGNFNDIAALTGAYVKESIYLPRLRVNNEATDDTDKPVPVGAFKVSLKDQPTVYGKPASFRVFMNTYQYSQYINGEGYVNHSVIIKSFTEEALDMLGGVRCGKVTAKNFDYLSAEDKVIQATIKCNRQVYGLVTLQEAADADGNIVEVINTPVMLRLSGGSFMAPKDALDSITKMKHQYFQHNLLMTTKREKKGSNVYYSLNITPDLKNMVEFTNDNMDTFKMFQEVIDRENNFITSKWREVKKSRITDYDISVERALSLDDEISL